jgi:hypothetical protein
MTAPVEHLKKVTLELYTDTRKETFVFVCGAASEGFCPFEYELLHKIPGDQLRLSVPRAKVAQTFGHLYMPLRMALHIAEPPETFDLKITITSVCDPAPREIIQAMAQATDRNGCGGACGCGCGGH